VEQPIEGPVLSSSDGWLWKTTIVAWRAVPLAQRTPIEGGEPMRTLGIARQCCQEVSFLAQIIKSLWDLFA
jgi:hypothetical protein